VSLARSAGRVAVSLVPSGLALLLGLAVAGGCRGREPVPQERAEAPRDWVDSLAGEVERRFQAATGDTAETDAVREAAAAAQELVHAVLSSQTPPGGWTPVALEAALLERRLAAQVREIERRHGPWILLVADPRRPESPDLVLLTYPEASSLARLETAPFLQAFQLAAWEDTLGPALLVAGTRRSPAGPQPAAWLFRLPAAAPVATDPVRFLACAGQWGLAASGPARLSFAAADPDSAPRLVVTDSALPNPLFDECRSCPHLEADVEYHYDGFALVADKRRVRHTPYSAFVGFVQALTRGDDPAAAGYAAGEDVLAQARSLGFDRVPHGGRWRIAPGVSPNSLDQTYVRGQEGAFRVLFAPGDSGFVVTSVSPTTFKLD
jgi:hypothetical protein